MVNLISSTSAPKDVPLEDSTSSTDSTRLCIADELNKTDEITNESNESDEESNKTDATNATKDLGLDSSQKMDVGKCR